MNFIGRTEELEHLKQLLTKKSASLVVIRGRRRIGKSRLINEFGNSVDNFIEFQGLGPSECDSNQKQLQHFSRKISKFFKTHEEIYQNWFDALSSLAQKTKRGRFLILLDEISWMARYDKEFPAILKDVWDTQFSKNPHLIMVLCGSITTWITENILNSSNFVGRISLEILLQELKLSEINSYWKGLNVSSFEKMLALSAIGGVPKYLEEWNQKDSAEANILRLFFSKNGFLYHEYEKIFAEILGRRYLTMEKIIRATLTSKLSLAQLSKKLKIGQTKDLTDAIKILEESGFVSRDYYFHPNQTISKASHIRVKDNYLRFYLKYVEPNKKKIEKGGKVYTSLSQIKGLESILGLQFENLILANRTDLYPHLKLHSSQILSAAPYVQRNDLSTKKGCQIDLLIQTNLDVFFLCEMKCQRIIDRTVIKSVKEKMSALKLPRRSTVKPVLIYEGEIYPPHFDEIKEFFIYTIDFESLLR